MRRLRRRDAAIGKAIVGGYQVLSRAGRALPLAHPRVHDLDHVRDVPYGPHPAQRLDVYRPRRADGPRPVVLYVHGGAFQHLSKDTHWLMGLIFGRRGYVFFNVDYRLAPAHRFPTPLEDVVTAYDYVVNNAARFGGDPRRVVLAGESAGANLVTALALAQCYPREEPWAKAAFQPAVRPRAVVPACGVFQVSDLDRLARRRPLPRLVRGALRACEHGYLPAEGADLALADPLLLVEREAPTLPLPPFFLGVGTRDPLLDDTRRLGQALRARGATVETRYYPGGLHAFHAFVWQRIARDYWRESFDFLRTHVGDP